uniref:Ig-like domain-containing protein n=1 Tax=Electrophorus electricus TaxID=8005 RepID=A0A4W4DQ93_ELEEL
FVHSGVQLVLECYMYTPAKSLPLCAGRLKYGISVDCNETSYELSVMYEEEIIVYFDDKEDRVIYTLPDFAAPIMIPDLIKNTHKGGEFCKMALAVLNDVYGRAPEDTVPPWSSIYPKTETVVNIKNTLICHVTGFFPPPVRVLWSRNDVNMTEGVYVSPYYHNIDGTFNVFSALAFTPEDGDIFSCTVEHQALQGPQTRMWGETPLMTGAFFHQAGNQGQNAKKLNI